MSKERSAAITIGGKEYELVLTTRATKEIAGRYGGLENLGDRLMKSENFEMALDEIIWLITLLANQSVLIHNLQHPEDKKEPLTQDAMELLTSPFELAGYKEAIMEAMYKGTKRNIESETDSKKDGLKKRGSRVTDAELFTRLFYYGTAQLGFTPEETMLLPFGLLLDLWECHKQFLGLARPKRELTIDDVIPYGI